MVSSVGRETASRYSMIGVGTFAGLLSRSRRDTAQVPAGAVHESSRAEMDPLHAQPYKHGDEDQRCAGTLCAGVF